jgi:hypothetical protein
MSGNPRSCNEICFTIPAPLAAMIKLIGSTHRTALEVASRLFVELTQVNSRRFLCYAVAAILLLLGPALACGTAVATSFQGVTTAPLSTGSLTLTGPQSVALDSLGNVHIADTNNHRVVEVTAAGVASVLSFPAGSSFSRCCSGGRIGTPLCCRSPGRGRTPRRLEVTLFCVRNGISDIRSCDPKTG